MELDPVKVGRQINNLRRLRRLTQSQLGERLNISFQAVSKWERGESLPDVALLPALASILETSIDYILTGGQRGAVEEKTAGFTRNATVAQMREGIECFVRIGELLGKDSFFYQGAVGGVSLKMNMDMEESLGDPNLKELLVAEAAFQAITDGARIELEDIRAEFKDLPQVQLLIEHAKKFGIGSEE